MTIATSALILVALTVAPAAASTVTEFPIPTAGSFPVGIARGPDAALWFTEAKGNNIGRITTAGTFTEFPIPTASSNPVRIVSGPDGALWFTESKANKIGRITTTGAITEFPIPTANGAPIGITSGPDGALWFTENGASQIGRITTAGAISEFPIPSPNSGPIEIVSGPDGALWFTEERANKIGRITTAGVLTEFQIPPPAMAFPPTTFPRGITAGPDGALWFTEYRGNQIGRITTAGAITEFPIPTALSGPFDIARGPDNALWFTENGVCVTVQCTPPTVSQIGRITTSGLISEFPTLTASSHPTGIALGLDSALWFTEIDLNANNIGRISATKRSASATLACSPARVRVRTATKCAFHVSDVDGDARTAPTGTVSFAANKPGGKFGSGGSCALSAVSTEAASCQLTYTPGRTGAQQITATYSGDAYHIAASATTALTVITPPPTVTRARESHSRWALGSKLARFAAKQKPAIGTTFSFNLNERARVKFAFNQQQDGRKIQGKCVSDNKKNRHKPLCKRVVLKGKLVFSGHAGKNKVSFQGRISRSYTLKPGKYTLVITATDAAHQHSKPRKLSFTIVK